MRILLLALLALAGCQTAAPPAQGTPRYHLIDLTGDFVRFYDATQGQSDEERLAAFYRDVAPCFPQFYDRARFDDNLQDRRVLTSIQGFPALRERYLRASTQFAAAMDPAFTSFERAFPDMQPVGDIYLIHSLSEMDGGTRTFDGQTYFIFGADVMARVHAGFSSESPFFHHELFHIYHARFFGDCEPIWCGLWQEGLAVYVASQLNPNATDAELLLSSPQPIRPAVDANRALAFCAVKARLDSTDQNDYRQLFQGQAHVEGLPARAGYYVGYLVAQEAGRTHTLQQLAHMPPSEVRPLIEQALTTLAPNCPVN